MSFVMIPLVSGYVLLGGKGPANVHKLVKHGLHIKTKIDY